MSLDIKDYFVKQISHLSKGVVIVALALCHFFKALAAQYSDRKIFSHLQATGSQFILTHLLLCEVNFTEIQYLTLEHNNKCTDKNCL